MNKEYFENTLEMLELQVRKGLHITNIDNIEQKISTIKPLINPIQVMELNGLISQIKLDISNAKINRNSASRYRSEFQDIFAKIRNP